MLEGSTKKATVQPTLFAYFGANRSVVSGESDQSFRSNPITLKEGGGAVA